MPDPIANDFACIAKAMRDLGLSRDEPHESLIEFTRRNFWHVTGVVVIDEPERRTFVPMPMDHGLNEPGQPNNGYWAEHEARLRASDLWCDPKFPGGLLPIRWLEM